MNYWLFLIPIISAFIGWVTNWIAIKMLFYPREPRKILFITFHGIFPKRQQAFAENIGKLVSDELLSYDDIQQKITNPQNLKKIMPMIEGHIETFLRVKLSDEMPFLSLFIGDRTINSLKKVFTQELEILFPQIMRNYTNTLRSELDLEKIVREKVAGFSSEKLESILYQVMSKEFRFVEIIGGIIGFIIGLVQVMITILTI
ncbi:MAG: DUF445 family protein [Chitinophagaceae bacterium]|nr:MAG: DUF445 family protein [Chitinophagaceae bacterium]